MKNSLLSPVNRGLRVRKLRESIKISRPQLAKLAGCGESSLQFWEEGKGNGITPKSAKLLIDFFNHSGVICTLEWLMSGSGSEPVLATNLAISAQQEILIPSLNTEIQAFHHWHQDAVTLLIVDDAMTPFYSPGDYVAGKKRYGNAIELLMNEHCIIEIENKTLCRIIKASSKNERYNLVSTNPYSDSEFICLVETKIISAAKVIWHRRPE